MDRQLKQWVVSVLPEATVSLSAPDPVQPGQGVSLYLLELVPTPPPRTTRRPPLQVTLHYLVTTWAETPEMAHHLLGELVFAGLEHPEWTLETAPLPPTLWQALGTPPRPAFVLHVPLRRERPAPETARVWKGVKVQISPVRSLYGQLLGPEEAPIADARIELPALEQATHTDFKGRFHFAAVPVQPAPRQIRIRAREREVIRTLEALPAAETPLILRLTEEEV